ncbi:PilN domain-containing protein [Lysobacter sp. N42]|uniref:PilN domain-containing protein n=1 Tax=Lysobacter sp. N42 TaxID=2545719 RepID=UPI00104A9F72|nr:general secretion pathway protein GspL [Lysobacter sp. N42]
MTSVLGGRLRGLGRFGARLAPQATGLRGLLAWWGRALAAWLPLRVRRVLGFDRGRLLLQPAGDDVALRLHREGALQELGHLPAPPPEPGVDPLAGVLAPAAQDLPRWLLLPAASGLVRRMALPAAAADRLRDVVRFEIDRQTPFAAEAVMFDARLLGRRPDGQLDVELVVAPREGVDAQLAALGGLGGRLAGIDMAGADGLPRGVNLLDPAARGTRHDPWRLWNLVLGSVALLGITAALWLVLDNRRAAADALEQAVRERTGPAREAAAQRQVLTDLIEGQAFLDGLRRERPAAVEVMDELTRRLPDGTYLEKLAIEQDKLTLMGLSNQASALVTQLQGSQLWHAPALAGAVQPDPASGRDRFTLVADVGPADATPAGPRP